LAAQVETNHSIPKCLHRKKKPSVRFLMEIENEGKEKLWAYLIPIVVSLFKIGCHIESSLRLCWLKKIMTLCCLRELLFITAPTYATLLSAVEGILAIRFDSDSYPIGVGCHASHCMANTPHLFEDLKLNAVGEVKGIKQGLDIKGIGTFRFELEDDNSKMHKIKNPNSLFLPDLKKCLLSTQHWAQEAGDKYPLPRGTRMENNDENCILIWGQAKHRKSIPYNPSSNVPIMYTTSSLSAYPTVATSFEAHKAIFFCREKVLQFPGCRCAVDEPDLIPEEFVAEDNINYCKEVLASEGVNSDDKMVKTSNLPLPPQDEKPSKVIQ
jgi:hypothetical protein